MQGQTTEPTSKVVSLFKAREQKAAVDAEATSEAKPGESFEDVMRRNAENRERLRKERSKANQSVLRSYKIKN
jgi:hypothetical protein